MNNGVIFWLIVAVVLGMIEAATANLVTVWAAIADTGFKLTKSVFGCTRVKSAIPDK